MITIVKEASPMLWYGRCPECWAIMRTDDENDLTKQPIKEGDGWRTGIMAVAPCASCGHHIVWFYKEIDPIGQELKLLAGE